MNTNMPADESDISSEESKWSLRTIDETGSTISSLDKGDSGTLRDLDDQIGGQVYNEDDEITTINLDNYFMIDNPTTTYIRRFQTTGYDFQVKFKNLDKANLYKLLPKLFDRILDKVVNSVEENGLIGIAFRHPSLKTPILVYFRPRKNLTGDIICDTITKTLQSNQGIEIESDSAALHVVTILPHSGSGLHSNCKYRLHDNLIKKRSLIIIKNNDNLCLARAIVVAIARIEKDPKWNSIRQGDKNRHYIQAKRARRLMEKAGLKQHSGPCGIKELSKIQDIVSDYQIRVFSIEHFGGIIFEGMHFGLYCSGHCS